MRRRVHGGADSGFTAGSSSPANAVADCARMRPSSGGFEPPTRGLEDHPDKPQRTATNTSCLQGAQTVTATSCSKMRVTETTPYAHRTFSWWRLRRLRGSRKAVAAGSISPAHA